MYEISPHPSALLNAGYSYEYAKEHAKAVVVYRKYLSVESEKTRATVTDVENRLAMLTLLVGELHILYATGECTVEIDGVLKGKTHNGHLEIIMAPGLYEVTVIGEDNKTTTHDYRVEAGGQTNARFSIASSDAGTAAQPPSVSDDTTATDLDATGVVGPQTNTLVKHADVKMGHTPKITFANPSTRKSDEKKQTALQLSFYVMCGGAMMSGLMATVLGSLTLKARNDFNDSGYTDGKLHDVAIRYRLGTNILAGTMSLFIIGAMAVKIIERHYRKNTEKQIALAVSLSNEYTIGLRGNF